MRIGVVASGFNTLAVRLREFHEGLEQKVAQRTEELREEVARHKETGGKLQRVQTFLDTVIQTIPDPILVIDRNHRVVLANEAAWEMAGGEAPPETRRTCFELSHGVDAPCESPDHECPFPAVMDRKETVRVTHIHTGQDGEPRWVEIAASPVLDEEGEVVQMVELCRDITERMRAEEGEAALGRIIEESLNEVCIFHRETLKFLAVSRGARENLGYSTEELAEMTPLDIEPEISAEVFRRLLRPLAEGDRQSVRFITSREAEG